MHPPLYKVFQEEDYSLYLRLGAPSAWGSRGMNPEIWAYLCSQDYLHHPSERLRSECEYVYRKWKNVNRALAITLIAAAGLCLLGFFLYGTVSILG